MLLLVGFAWEMKTGKAEGFGMKACHNLYKDVYRPNGPPFFPPTVVSLQPSSFE